MRTVALVSDEVSPITMILRLEEELARKSLADKERFIRMESLIQSLKDRVAKKRESRGRSGSKSTRRPSPEMMREPGSDSASASSSALVQVPVQTSASPSSIIMSASMSTPAPAAVIEPVEIQNELNQNDCQDVKIQTVVVRKQQVQSSKRRALHRRRQLLQHRFPHLRRRIRLGFVLPALVIGDRRFVINSIKRLGKLPNYSRFFKIKKFVRDYLVVSCLIYMTFSRHNLFNLKAMNVSIGKVLSILKGWYSIWEHSLVKNLLRKICCVLLWLISGCIRIIVWDPGGLFCYFVFDGLIAAILVELFKGNCYLLREFCCKLNHLASFKVCVENCRSPFFCSASQNTQALKDLKSNAQAICVEVLCCLHKILNLTDLYVKWNVAAIIDLWKVFQPVLIAADICYGITIFLRGEYFIHLGDKMAMKTLMYLIELTANDVNSSMTRVSVVWPVCMPKCRVLEVDYHLAFNVIDGGSHVGNKLAMQNFIILHVGVSSFKEAMKVGVEVDHYLNVVIKKKYDQDATNVGYEGGIQLHGLTLSDATLILWRGSCYLQTFSGHMDTILELSCMSVLGILSASHDDFKLWARIGEVLMEMYGHNSIVYFVDSNSLGIICSGSEDHFVKIWRDSVCFQSIEYTGYVWNAKFLDNGDFVTACSDRIAFCPENKRYTRFPGKFVVQRVNGRILQIICNAMLVETEFGTEAIEGISEKHRRKKGAFQMIGNKIDQLICRKKFKGGVRTQIVLKLLKLAAVFNGPSTYVYEICVEELGSIVEGHDLKKLKFLGGVEGIASKLSISIDQGLDKKEACFKARQEAFGINKFAESEYKSFFVFVWEALQDMTLLILAICAFVSLIVGIVMEGWSKGAYDGLGIVASILLVVFVNTTSDYRQSLQFKELDKEKKKISIQVTRNKFRKKIVVYELIPGDVVHGGIGDEVPTDGFFIYGFSLLINESSLTREKEYSGSSNGNSDSYNDDIYSSCNCSLALLLKLFQQASQPGFEENCMDNKGSIVKLIALEADNLLWLLEILISRFLVLSSAIVYGYYNMILKIDEEEFGGHTTLIQ